MMNWQTTCRVSPGMQACVLSAGGLQYTRHWKEFDKAVYKILTGEINRLVINIAPQWGKSEYFSKNLPAWYLGKYPEKKVILASYESNYAASWGRKARDVFVEYSDSIWGVKPGSPLASNWWYTEYGGYMATAGITAGITGRGAHLFIIDDPVKNSEEAHSETIREKMWDEYCATVMTRLQPGAAIILIQTRWHGDDLTGRLLERESDKWHKIIMPALDDNDQSMYEERYTTKELHDRRDTMGEYMFNALYQQSPTSRGGGMFKTDWFKYYDKLPERFDKVIQSWDLTFGDTGTSFVVGLILGKVGANTYIIDMYRGKWDFPMQTKKIKEAYVKYPQSRRKLIEKKANGQATIDTLKPQIPGIIAINPTESKEARASAVSYVVESGNVFFPSTGPIKAIAEKELPAFPNGSTDDFTDALTQGLADLYNRKEVTAGLIEDL